MKSLIQQVKIYGSDERLRYAKTMDMASLHNLRCNLKYYMKHRKSMLLKETIKYLTQEIREMNEAKTVEQILMIEARCRQKYYHCFNEMFSSNAFHFLIRTKRPPKDEVNAMISFGMYIFIRKLPK